MNDKYIVFETGCDNNSKKRNNLIYFFFEFRIKRKKNL